MFELIDYLQDILEPRLSRDLQAVFVLHCRQADHILLLLVWMILAELRWILMHPNEHPIFLAGLLSFFCDDHEGVAKPAYFREVALGLGATVLASRRAVVVDFVEATSSLDAQAGGQIIALAVPQIFWGLRRYVQEKGLRGLVGVLVGEQPGLGEDQVDALVATWLAVSSDYEGQAGEDELRAWSVFYQMWSFRGRDGRSQGVC